MRFCEPAARVCHSVIEAILPSTATISLTTMPCNVQSCSRGPKQGGPAKHPWPIQHCPNRRSVSGRDSPKRAERTKAATVCYLTAIGTPGRTTACSLSSEIGCGPQNTTHHLMLRNASSALVVMLPRSFGGSDILRNRAVSRQSGNCGGPTRSKSLACRAWSRTGVYRASPSRSRM